MESVRDVRKFMGIMNICRPVTPGLTEILRPLMALPKGASQAELQRVVKAAWGQIRRCAGRPPCYLDGCQLPDPWSADDSLHPRRRQPLGRRIVSLVPPTQRALRRPGFRATLASS
ncbi:hypothetical protein BSKO_00147 [Bryopsis sp. KO-2023]|nr:hypothetical protein BSKO_00147 [Bryopsis sp. KO-2023]